MTVQRKESPFSSQGVPERFICPLTLEIMEHPLMTIAGHSFERSAIFGWLQRNDTHPLTREPLGPRDLVNNGALKMEITAWKAKHGYIPESETEDSSSEDDSVVGTGECFLISSISIEELEAQLQLGASHPRRQARATAEPSTATTSSGASMTTGETGTGRKRRPRFSFGVLRRR